MEIDYGLIYHFHPIILKNSTSNNSNKCSFCNVSLKSNFYLCKECKFALCDLCVFKILYHNNKINIHQHSCTLSKKEHVSCFICEQNFNKFLFMFCPDCKINICLKCYIKKENINDENLENFLIDLPKEISVLPHEHSMKLNSKNNNIKNSNISSSNNKNKKIYCDICKIEIVSLYFKCEICNLFICEVCNKRILIYNNKHQHFFFIAKEKGWKCCFCLDEYSNDEAFLKCCEENCYSYCCIVCFLDDKKQQQLFESDLKKSKNSNDKNDNKVIIYEKKNDNKENTKNFLVNL